MDKLDRWVVQGRVATAAQRVREGLAQLVADSEELTEAMAEAERLETDSDPDRNTWAFQPVGDSVEWLLPARSLMLGAGPETTR